MADYSITGDTRLDASGFNKGLSAMSVAAGNLISGLTQAATGKLTELAKTSVGVGMSFQSSMSQVAATMGVGVDQIQSLTDKAKEMGSTTAFTATQAADALNYLALAGYDANKAAEVLPSVLNLAAAGGMDLAYASDLVTKSMASLQIEATKQNVDEFGNKLAVAASHAGATVSQLGEAILTVGGTAANLKGGTTELTTALGKLADVGYVGAEGGTHLRNIILSLQSPTDDATKLMEQLGLQVYDAQGNMRGLDDILTDLNGSLAGLTQGQKDSVINVLFNKTDLAAVKGLLAAQGEQWESLAQQIDAAGEAAGDSGAMAQMAETQLDNLQGSVTIMQSALEGLQLGIYEYLEPSLNEAAKWGSACFTTLTKALNEGGPEAMLQAAGQIISDLAASVTAQLPGLVTSGTEIIVQLAEDIVAAIPQLLSSGAEIIGALVQALGVALPQLVSTGIQMISQLSAGLASGIPEFLAKALPLVADFASGLRENIGQIIDAGIGLILSLMQGLMDGLPTLIEYLPGIVSDIAGIINDNTPKILEAGIQLILMLGKGLLQAVPTLVANIPQICKAIFDVFTAFRWLDIGSQIVEGLWKGLTSGWTALVKKVGGLAQQLPDIVKRVLGIHSPSKVFDEIGVNTCKGLAQGLSKGTAQVKHAAKTVVASVTDTATQIVDGVTTVTETVTETMANGSTQQKQIITETSQQIIDGVAKTVKTVTERATDGSESVKRSIEAVRDVVSTVTATQTALVDGAKVTTQTTTETLADGSEQVKRVITSTGTEVIEGVQHTVKTVTTIAADGTQTVAKTIEDAGPQYGSVGELLTTQFRTKLTEGWAQIQSDIQTDALGAIETLATALKDGDLESLGLWAASYFWQACTKEQQTQINSIALGALNQLGSALSGVFGNLSQLAMGLVAQFVPAAASATAGQTALNVAMDANPILLVISLIGMLVGALLNLSGKNKDVANGFQSVWAGVEDFMSYIFEGLMRIVAAGIEGFVILINGLIGLYNSVAWLWGDHVDYISNPAWNFANQIAADRKARQAERKKQQEAANNPSSSGTSANSQKVIESMTDTSKTTRADGSTVTTKVLTEKLQDETGKITQRVTKTVTEAGTKLVDGVERSYKTVTTYVDGIQTKVERSLDDITKTTTGTKPGSTTPTAPTPDKDLTDAVEANTEALLAANSKLAEMVRQANTLVLSDNMAISRSVAASGTAQVAAAANQYHREGDTNIIQNIYSKAQTAADLQREARWEADRAKAQKR